MAPAAPRPAGLVPGLLLALPGLRSAGAARRWDLRDPPSVTTAVRRMALPLHLSAEAPGRLLATAVHPLRPAALTPAQGVARVPAQASVPAPVVGLVQAQAVALVRPQAAALVRVLAVGLVRLQELAEQSRQTPPEPLGVAVAAPSAHPAPPSAVHRLWESACKTRKHRSRSTGSRPTTINGNLS